MARRQSASARKEPYFTKQHLEGEADVLLAEYGRAHGMITEPPIPIDEIVEVYLKLTLEFNDMQAIFGVADVHGALWVNQSKVGVDISLDPDRNPAKLGRYHFTLAHEAGHWRLHRHLFQRRANQLTLLPDLVDRAEYVCRSSDTSPLEWQANFFAAALLMPRELIKRAWHARQGNMDPIYLPDLRLRQNEILAREALRRGGLVMSEDAIGDALFEHACRPLAEQFQVSVGAMRIRLEEVGLMCRTKENTLF